MYSVGMNSTYYISTGDLNGFYTLRHRFVEAYQIVEGDQVSIGYRDRDFYVRNLSTDREQAIAKAKEHCGRLLDVDFDLDEIRKRPAQEIDWSIFQAGKHDGKSIHQVRDEDPGYLIWLCETACIPNKYVQTAELAKALVAHELESRAGERAAKAAAVASRAQEIIEALGRKWVDAYSTGDQGFVCSVLGDLNRGIVPSPKALSILLEIHCKCWGRCNSKAFKARWEEVISKNYFEEESK